MSLRTEAERNDAAERFDHIATQAQRRVELLSRNVDEIVSLRNEIADEVAAGSPAFTQTDVDELDAEIDSIVQQIKNSVGQMPTTWEKGVNYTTDDVVIYKGEHYRVLQDHTSDKTPDSEPTLYEIA